VSWVIPDGRYSDHPGGTTPPYSNGGPDWVSTIVNSVGNSQDSCDSGKGYWNDTAILIVWDDWGGFYDHVPPYERLINTTQPPNCSSFGCGYVSGFRVPLLVVSAYTPKGYISGRCAASGNSGCTNDQAPYQHDFGSILNFVEYVFGLPQGGISGTGPSWNFDDYWAPDYYANGSCNNSQQLCPYGLSDFFNFAAPPAAFTAIPALTHHTAEDFLNLTRGQPEDPDEETP